MIRRTAACLAAAWAATMMSGCIGAPSTAKQVQLEEQSMDCLRRGVRYEFLPLVRAQAVESLEEIRDEQVLPWMRLALRDEHPGVRFAACMALGTRKDEVSRSRIEELLQSDIPSDQIGAVYALYQLGDTRHASSLAGFLFDASSKATQMNAALALGRMGDPGAIKLLERLADDEDAGLRFSALEAMALLGSEEAWSVLYGQAFTGVGDAEVFAINALAETRKPKLRNLFRDKLRGGARVETRLAAARGLGLLGVKDGLGIARTSVNYRTTKDVEGDPAANRTLRVRQMAILACGAIGEPVALWELEPMLRDADDPRLQVAAARAILEIVGRAEE